MGHFVSSPREREKKRQKRADEMKERDREERGTGMKVKKQKKLEKVSIGRGCPRKMPFRKRVYM